MLIAGESGKGYVALRDMWHITKGIFIIMIIFFWGGGWLLNALIERLCVSCMHDFKSWY